jgi:nucleotide-binding universal stress UspA family protein
MRRQAHRIKLFHTIEGAAYDDNDDSPRIRDCLSVALLECWNGMKWPTGAQTMYQHILVATDGSALATKALEHGVNLAKRKKAKVTVVTVTELWSALDIAHEVRQGQADPIGHYERLAAAGARRILDSALQHCKAHGVACDPIHVNDQHPAEGIIATAKDRGCDLIVMASHGRRGVPRLLLGSQTHEVLTHCEVPVLVVR